MPCRCIHFYPKPIINDINYFFNVGPGFSPRGHGPRPRFPFRGEEMEHDDQHRDHDGEYGRGRHSDRGSDRGRDRGGDRGRDRGGDRGRDRNGQWSMDRSRSREEERGDSDRSRVRGHDSINAVSDDSSSKTNKEESEEPKSAKRSRWSNNPPVSSGLDDASHKLARNTALEIAAKFANLSKPPADVPQQPEPEPEPVKPVIDITKANTEETVSNVLGQLYDDDDDDDDDEPSPPVETKTPAAPVVEEPSAAATLPEAEPVTAPSPPPAADLTETKSAVENEPITDCLEKPVINNGTLDKVENLDSVSTNENAATTVADNEGTDNS